jgi:hypothetical protein
MSMRISFTLDNDLAHQIEQFATEKRIERNEAILRLIEAGVEKYTEDNSFVPVPRERSFEEVKVIKRTLESLTDAVVDLKKEIRVVHHILDLKWQKDQLPLPQETRRWWEFWKGL